MRQRHIKAATNDFLESAGVITKAKKIDDIKQPIFLELGSGKGQFITSLAKEYPDKIFVAMEINPSVLYRIALKKIDERLVNLIIILDDAKNIVEYFGDNKLHGVYLNFCDPWPKPKHNKRRLTAPSFLKIYKNMLVDKGFIQFRTDHLSFFEDTLYEMHGLVNILDVKYNLKPSKHMTEYEEKKRKLGPIYQVIAEVNKDA